MALTGRAIRADAPTVPEGGVAFSVTNSGARPYSFVVRGEGLEERTEPVEPGGTALLSTSLKPGVYELLTVPEQEGPVPGDIRRTLRVTEGDTPPHLIESRGARLNPRPVRAATRGPIIPRAPDDKKPASIAPLCHPEGAAAPHLPALSGMAATEGSTVGGQGAGAACRARTRVQ